MIEPDTLLLVEKEPWTVTMCGKTYATIVRNDKMRIIRVKDYI